MESPGGRGQGEGKAGQGRAGHRHGLGAQAGQGRAGHTAWVGVQAGRGRRCVHKERCSGTVKAEGAAAHLSSSAQEATQHQDHAPPDATATRCTATRAAAAGRSAQARHPPIMNSVRPRMCRHRSQGVSVSGSSNPRSSQLPSMDCGKCGVACNRGGSAGAGKGQAGRAASAPQKPLVGAAQNSSAERIDWGAPAPTCWTQSGQMGPWLRYWQKCAQSLSSLQLVQAGRAWAPNR